MNKQYKNPIHYTNNHCTESAVEFTPDLMDSSPSIDTCDEGQAQYDTLEDWANMAIDRSLLMERCTL